MHIWMVHKRLIKEEDTKKYNKMEECVFDEFWDDTTNRISKQDVSVLSLNKYLKQVQNTSFAMCFEFDNALTNHDETLMLELIGSAIWQYLYEAKEDISEEDIEELARYTTYNTLLYHRSHYCITISSISIPCIFYILFFRYVRNGQLIVDQTPLPSFLTGNIAWPRIPWEGNKASTMSERGLGPNNRRRHE